jgi:8-oxo-dGTP diphosphatase
MSGDGLDYRHQLRLRVCGVLVVGGHILVARIHSPVTDQQIWTPPGGGLEFGESLSDGVRREFAEETNLQVAVQRLVHINELIRPPFHAVEFYFEVSQQGGESALGEDPEHPADKQLLKELIWVPLGKLSEKDFAPQSLVPKLMDWEQRHDFNPYKRS